MNKYSKNINLNIKNKFKNANYHYSNYLKNFFDSRIKLKKKILLQRCYNYKKNNDKTLNDLKYIFFNKKKNKKKIFVFYKKFEINLKLKIEYNKSNIAISKKNTRYESYIYLGHLIILLKNLNDFHKLNIILKILDILSQKKLSLSYQEKLLFLNLIEIESKIIKKIYASK